ncbi:MAG: hypothetical protein R3330_00070 [Saprospiraceae bacterium]|nr:hypothetical protein [Saprospiraceae bacterium]
MLKDQFIHRSLTGCIALLTAILLVTGCGKGSNIPSVDHLDGSFNLVRFEQELWSLDTMAPAADLSALQARHPEFSDLYFTHILPLSQVRDTTTGSLDAIRQIIGDPRLRFIADTVGAVFDDFSDVEQALRQAFQYYLYYFPGNRPPAIYTLISDFGYFPFIFEDADGDAIGISLEMFLGTDFAYRDFVGNHPAFSDYLRRSLNRDHIVKKVLDVLIDDIMGPPPGDRLIDLMLHNGKRLYLLDQLLPTHPDSVIMEYTPEQLAWCAQNERNLWAHLLTEDLLYSNEFSKINKLVNYSPNVPGLPEEAVGRVANWTGWQIIRAWRQQQPDLSVVEIIATRDAQKLLELARYKPR